MRNVATNYCDLQINNDVMTPGSAEHYDPRQCSAPPAAFLSALRGLRLWANKMAAQKDGQLISLEPRA